VPGMHVADAAERNFAVAVETDLAFAAPPDIVGQAAAKSVGDVVRPVAYLAYC
jgi:hypothetical protein